MPIIPSIPATQAQNSITIIEPILVSQQKVFVFSPTTEEQKIIVMTANEAARDQSNIIVQTITQDYFQNNLIKFVPHEWRRLDNTPKGNGGGEGDLGEFLNVFAITLDEIKQFIDDFTLLFDIDHCPTRYLIIIAKLLNFPLEETDSTEEQRRQLKTAISWYKSKGSRSAFEAFLYAFGFYANLVPLWTEDYETFYETVPGVARGNNPPNDFPLLVENGGTWYRSPHFGVRLKAIIEDKHLFIEFPEGFPSDILDEFNSRAEEIGKHWAFYEYVDTLVENGAYLRYNFTIDDFNYIYRRIEHIRPAFTVLDWLELTAGMYDFFTVEDGILETTVNPTREEKGWYLGYCDLDDITYTRLDSRLLGDNPLAVETPLFPIDYTSIDAMMSPVEDYVFPNVEDMDGSPPLQTDVTDEVAASITEAVWSAVGTLDYTWVYPNTIEFTVVVGGADITVTDNGEGVLSGSNIDGIVDYLTGSWQLLFYVDQPDIGEDILVSYTYSHESIPPVDRSGAMPRGSTELPFPHVRDPQRGICHPPEELLVFLYAELPDPYTFALTRDGMGVYPSSGAISFIDHSDFPSRGFDAGSGADHANTFDRSTGYSDRPLSLLEVEEISV